MGLGLVQGWFRICVKGWFGVVRLVQGRILV